MRQKTGQRKFSEIFSYLCGAKTKGFRLLNLRRMKQLVPIMILLLALASCGEREKFPVEPEITFISLEKIDNGTNIDDKATLTFHFQDGDGDIGLGSNDLSEPFDSSSYYYYNCFIDFYRKENGVFQKVEFEGITFNQRIPRLSNSVPESIEGDISIDLNINDYNLSHPTDTILFRCHIVDRALHESNEIETTPLVVRKQ